MNERQQQRKMANKTFLTIAKYHARCRRQLGRFHRRRFWKTAINFWQHFFPPLSGPCVYVWRDCMTTWRRRHAVKEKRKFFLFLHRGVSMFVFVCHCWRLQRERNSSKRFLSFPFKKKFFLPSGVLFFPLQDTQCRAFRYFYSDFLYPKTRTQSLTILPTNPWRDDIKNCPARNGSKNLFFCLFQSNPKKRELVKAKLNRRLSIQ